MCLHPSKVRGMEMNTVLIGTTQHLALRRDQKICKESFAKFATLPEGGILEVICYNSLPISQREDFLEEVFQHHWK